MSIAGQTIRVNASQQLCSSGGPAAVAGGILPAFVETGLYSSHQHRYTHYTLNTICPNSDHSSLGPMPSVKVVRMSSSGAMSSRNLAHGGMPRPEARTVPSSWTCSRAGCTVIAQLMKTAVDDRSFDEKGSAELDGVCITVDSRKQRAQLQESNDMAQD